MTAAIKAVFVDYRRIKGRKVHQIIFEVDSAMWPAAYKVLGEPEIDTSAWFGIARMNVTEPAPTPKEQGSNLAANAAILMEEEPIFGLFLREGLSRAERAECDSTDTLLKRRLGIKSKSELNTDAAAAARWRDLRAEFEAWKRT